MRRPGSAAFKRTVLPLSPNTRGIFERVPSYETRTGRVNVIVDTPAGSRTKYKFDSELQIFRVSRVLPQGSTFPADFGSIPGTCAADGDALDVLVLNCGPSFPGCLLTVRLIGVVRARQREGRRVIVNDRLIGVVETPVNHPRVRKLGEIEPETIRAIEHFFVSYNVFAGRQFEIIGRGGPARAHSLLRKAMKAYERRSRP
jgi:inorganic pyrophosphatase